MAIHRIAPDRHPGGARRREPRISRGATTKFFIRIALAAALLALLFLWSGLDGAAVVETLGRLDANTYACAVAIHVVIYGLRAWRFAVLVPREERPPWHDVLVVSSAHNLAAQVLPAKTGELTLVVYLKSRCGVSASAAAASLLVSRLLDVLVLAFGGGVAALLVSREHGSGIAAMAAGLLVVALLGAALLGRAPRLAAACARFTADRGRRVARVGEIALRLGEALGAAGRRSSLVPALLVSLPLWLCVFVFWVVLSGDLGLPADVGHIDAAFAAALASLASLVPLSAFGGFGPMEAGWQLGFTLVGVEPQLGLAVGLAVHLVQLFNVAVFGAIAHLVMALRPARPRATAE